MSPTDWVASVGVTLLLAAFVLNQLGRMADDSLSYLLLNLVGAAVAGSAAWMGGILPFVLLEGVWGAVAAWGVIGWWRRAPALRRLA